MTPGGFRIDLATVPLPILTMWMDANTALRGSWTLGERLREIIRLWSAAHHGCHT